MVGEQEQIVTASSACAVSDIEARSRREDRATRIADDNLVRRVCLVIVSDICVRLLVGEAIMIVNICGE